MPPNSQSDHGLQAPKVTVIVDRCAGCQECVVRCPTAALSMDVDSWVAQADDALCVGCRQCVRTCPFSAIKVDGPMLAGPRTELPLYHAEHLVGDIHEIRQGIATMEAAVAEASRCLECPDPTCVRGCPVHNDIPGFLAALRRDDLAAANHIIRRTSVLPDICSRVCDQAVQCEGSCSWSLAGGEAVAIGALERFITDHSPVPPPARQSDAGEGLKVAVVGSGPAGIGATWDLLEAGAEVTVFEKDAEPGGLFRWGIPDFTLPAAIAHRPWDQLRAAGADLRCSSEVKADQIDALLAEHDAVVLANGAGMPLRLPVPGGDLEGVTDATTFLTAGHAALEDHRDFPELQLGKESPMVLVLGAGNTAMDVARTARRFGAKAICVDWMDRRFAPVRPDELAEAADEGVDVRFGRTLQRLEGIDGRVAFAHLAATRQSRATEQPKVIHGEPDVVAVDLVVMAMGYKGDPSFSAVIPGTPVRKKAEGLADREWIASGLLAVPDPAFARHQPVGQLALGREVGLISSGIPFKERCWVAGDSLVGPSTVVEAMAQGRHVAQAILAAQPSRSGAVTAPRVLVAYESNGGHTSKIAAELASAMVTAADHVSLMPLSKVGAKELAETDVLILGTWVEGFVVAKVGPAKATKQWLAKLPHLGGLRVATFCTYGIDPKDTLATMRQAIEAKGGTIIAEGAVGPRGSKEATASFATALKREVRAKA